MTPIEPIEIQRQGFVAVMYVVDEKNLHPSNSADLTLELALLTLNYSSEVNLKWLCQKPGEEAFTRHFSMAATNPKPNCMQMFIAVGMLKGQNCVVQYIYPTLFWC